MTPWVIVFAVVVAVLLLAPLLWNPRTHERRDD